MMDYLYIDIIQSYAVHLNGRTESQRFVKQQQTVVILSIVRTFSTWQCTYKNCALQDAVFVAH